jgi:sulfite reductase beta subunit-like hemoprotein
MENLKQIFLDELKEFNELGHSFLRGEVSKGDFKKNSGGVGVYAHRNGTEFMVRLRTPSGIVSKPELKVIYEIAKKHGLGGIHLTTRQAVQLHGLGIDAVCDVIREGMDHGIYAKGSGGNFPRNVAISPLSGVEKYEAFDVTPYALAVNGHFMSKINTYKLPRKLKVSFSSEGADQSHATAVDLGFLAVKHDGRKYFRVYIGGGMGMHSKLAVELGDLVDPRDVLYHVEAVTSLFVSEGDYENKAKARLRYVLDRLGKDEFISRYRAHLDEARNDKSLILPKFKPSKADKAGSRAPGSHPRRFKQKQVGLYSVYFHPIGGQLSLESLKVLIDELDPIDSAEIRLSMTEGLFIRNLSGTEATHIIDVTSGLGGETRLEQSVACIGVPTCQMGIAETQSTLNAVIDKFREKGLSKDILPSLYFSGCPNSCGVHKIGRLGFCGKMKKIDDVSKQIFELHVGGGLSAKESKFGEHYADIPQTSIPDFILELAQAVDSSKLDFDAWLDSGDAKLREIAGKYAV